ncbi:hypothetical protein SAMN05216436_11992 [bacterium A37T11]|nr:hypothetical protein SAMN05216436_11992 [bacterium A37T11]
MLKHIFQIVTLLTQIVVILNHLLNEEYLKALVSLLQKILENLPAAEGKFPNLATGSEKPPLPQPFTDNHGKKYSLTEVMPQKEAYLRLGISESKMKLMRKAQMFTVLMKEGDAALVKPTVWLLRTEVEAKRLSYSVPKGKV